MEYNKIGGIKKLIYYLYIIKVKRESTKYYFQYNIEKYGEISKSTIMTFFPNFSKAKKLNDSYDLLIAKFFKYLKQKIIKENKLNNNNDILINNIN